MKSAFILISFICLVAIKANAFQKDTTYKFGDFLIEVNGPAKIDFIIKKIPRQGRISKGDTLYEDEKYLILGDMNKTSIFGVYKKYKLKHKFSELSAVVYKGKLAPPDFKTDPKAKLFKTQIRDQCKEKGVNFAGHYTIAEWGCGTECQIIAIIDRLNGKIYYSSIQKSIELSYGIECRPDSRMMILNSGLLEQHKGYVACSRTMNVEAVEWLNTKPRRLPE